MVLKKCLAMEVFILIIWAFIGSCSCLYPDFEDYHPPPITVLSYSDLIKLRPLNKLGFYFTRWHSFSVFNDQFLDDYEFYTIGQNRNNVNITQRRWQRNGISHTAKESMKLSAIVNLEAIFLSEEPEQRLEELNEFGQSNLLCVGNCDYLNYHGPCQAVNVVLSPCKTNDSEANVTICSEAPESNEIVSHPGCDVRSARIMSQNLLRYTRLLEMLESPDLSVTPSKVLVCLPNTNANLNKDLFKSDIELWNSRNDLNYFITLEIQECDETTEFDEEFLAVIAGKPLKSLQFVPTIFYQMPYNDSQCTIDFPNSINLSTPWRSLKYALVAFLKRMRWYRVAVVSDHSEYSQDFSEDLLSLFRSDGNFAFTFQECEGRKCDFTKTLKKLDDAATRIVVLNMNRKHVEEVLSSEYGRKMRFATWIVRDWPCRQFRNKFPSDLYAFNPFSLYNANYDRNNAYNSSIREAISIVNKLYKKAIGDDNLFRRMFPIDAAKLKSNGKSSVVRFTHLNRKQSPRTVSDIIVTGGINAKVISFSMNEDEIPPDMAEVCLLRSFDFFTPCQYEVLLLLMGILIMFVLLLLISIVFFNYYRSQLRYNRFN